MTRDAELSYDAIPGFGMVYDAVPAYGARADVRFYVEEATHSEGPVLEFGCGTGRILLAIARAGCTIVGVDASRAMLERCEAKLLEEPDDLRARVALHERDVRDFDLGQRFALVIAPFRVMQHIASIEDQLHFLGAAARHLTPGGRLVFDVFNPSLRVLVSHDGSEHEDTPETPLPDGRAFRRAFRVVRVRWLDQVNETELVYYISPAPGAPATRYVQGFGMRWYLREELMHLLARGGFRVEALYGDFDRTPLMDGSPEIVVSATRA
jgi:SAM-dependent methyltransferase